MHGLFAYRIVPDLADGRVLAIENFVAADLCAGTMPGATSSR